VIVTRLQDRFMRIARHRPFLAPRTPQEPASAVMLFPEAGWPGRRSRLKPVPAFEGLRYAV
jgi:hypothetical protein